MDYSLFFNHLNLPATSEKEAYSLLIDSLQGVLHLKQGGDRFFLYFDGESLDDRELSENFTYGDFKSKLSDDYRDLQLFIYQIEDKSSFLDNLPEQLTEDLSQISSYFPNRPYNTNLDIFTAAWLQQGVMLSLATEEFWNSSVIKFLASKEKKNKPIQCQVYNISKKEHADSILEAINKKFEEKLSDICPNAIYHPNFLNWYDKNNIEEKAKIKEKLKVCCDAEFRLGRPFIDTLENSDFLNMKEIRIRGGASQIREIRILFAMTPERKPAILHGFFKYNDNYTPHIKKADKLFKDLLDND